MSYLDLLPANLHQQIHDSISSSEFEWTLDIGLIDTSNYRLGLTRVDSFDEKTNVPKEINELIDKYDGYYKQHIYQHKLKKSFTLNRLTKEGSVFRGTLYNDYHHSLGKDTMLFFNNGYIYIKKKYLKCYKLTNDSNNKLYEYLSQNVRCQKCQKDGSDSMVICSCQKNYCLSCSNSDILCSNCDEKIVGTCFNGHCGPSCSNKGCNNKICKKCCEEERNKQCRNCNFISKILCNHCKELDKSQNSTLLIKCSDETCRTSLCQNCLFTCGICSTLSCTNHSTECKICKKNFCKPCDLEYFDQYQDPFEFFKNSICKDCKIFCSLCGSDIKNGLFWTNGDKNVCNQCNSSFMKKEI